MSGAPMSQPAHRVHYTFAEYIALEQASNVKHEYLDGQIYAMAGGTPEHAALAAALSGLLFAQIKGGRFRVYSSDLRVRVLATGLATYPDVTVVCGPVERDPESPTTVTNPRVLVEVLSPSTKDYDLGEKFEHYKQIPSLTDVIYLWQTEPRAELRHREADGHWSSTELRPGTALSLASIN